METKVVNFKEPLVFFRADSVDSDKTLIKGVKVLEDSGVKWCLAFGSALGLYRDKEIIPEDTDIDVAVLVDDKTDIQDLIDRLSKEFFYLRSVTRENEQHQSAFTDKSGFIFDVCFYYPYDGKWISYCDEGYWVDDFKKIEKIETKYGKLPFPGEIEKYLEDRYGDWQIKQAKKSIKMS